MKPTSGQRNFSEVLVIGSGRLPSSIAVCLAASGCEVRLASSDPIGDDGRISDHISDLRKHQDVVLWGKINVVSSEDLSGVFDFVLIAGHQDKNQLRKFMSTLELTGREDQVIAVATDHIPLKSLQDGRKHPGQIVVMNWSEPAHTTFFLEIVHSDITTPGLVDRILDDARQYWKKDPYTVRAEIGVRGRMMTAMVREAMFLVDQGYANIEDIDRACRNDAGTYLPFAGNFQYMDLMGTYAYGVVMKKLNNELSNATAPPPTFHRYTGHA